eukprot:3816028-Rhodomonas_salina.3
MDMLTSPGLLNMCRAWSNPCGAWSNLCEEWSNLCGSAYLHAVVVVTSTLWECLDTFGVC